MVLRDELKPAMSTTSPVRWEVTQGLVTYPDALVRMEREVEAIRHGEGAELIWLLEHPPLYTAGTSANPADLVTPDRFPVFEAGRGGQYTYHGPGQRVAYVMLDLRKRGSDVRAFVTALEEWIIRTLKAFGIHGERREDRVGVWVTRPGREDKIAALGIRVRHGISFHGISINLDPDLSHFDGIVPCGISEHGVTSFRDLGLPNSMADLDAVMAQQFAAVFQADIIVT